MTVVVVALGVVIGRTHWRRSFAAPRRRRRGTDELLDHLEAVLQHLRAGATLLAALRQAPSGPILAATLRPLRAGLAVGLGMDRSIELQRRRSAGDDPPALDAFVDAIAILHGRGGPALPALERVDDTLRSARAIEAEVEVGAGQAMASAALLAALPAVLIVGLSALDARLAAFYLSDPVGTVCVATTGMLSYGSWWWMTWLVRAPMAP